MRARFVGQWVAAPVTALSLWADASGFGEDVPWQYLAIVSFLVFVALSGWQQWEQHRQLHEPERQIDVSIRPDPLRTGAWIIFGVDNTFAPRLMNIAYCSADLDFANIGQHQRTITRIRVEFREGRRWFDPRPREVVRLAPPRDVDGNTRNDSDGDSVNWTLPAGGPTQSYNVSFRSIWDATPLPKTYTPYLVFEVGGRGHARRIELHP